MRELLGVGPDGVRSNPYLSRCPNNTIQSGPKVDWYDDNWQLKIKKNICLGKVESQLKTHPLVENICVYGDSLQYHTVAIMVPIKNALEKLATELGKTEMNYERLCKDNDVIQVDIFVNFFFQKD